MSQSRRGGLGRGLAALIPTGPTEGPRMGDAAANVVLGGPRPETEADDSAPEPEQESASQTAAADDDTAAPLPSPTADGGTDSIGAVYREIPVEAIEPNPKQPRQVFDEEALAELVHSITEFGLMQPIVVREIEDGRFQLIMGERRWRASRVAEIETIPAIVRETADDAMLRDALLENIHRVQLNPLEEAAAYQQLLEEFDVTHEELAARIGRSRPVVSNTIRLLRLPVPVQRRVAAGILSAGHARALLSLEAGAEAQEQLAARIVAEGMTVRATEEAVVLANRAGADAAAGAEAPKRRKPIEMPGLQRVADRLSNDFDTKVTVNLGKRKGKIVVEFSTVDDLERILRLMNVEEGQSADG